MATALQNTGPEEFVDEATGYPAPPQSLRVNGKILTAFTGKFAAADGSYAAGVGIFLDPAPDAYHPFVVWTLILRPVRDGGPWMVEQGDYCLTAEEAREAYIRRGGKV